MKNDEPAASKRKSGTHERKQNAQGKQKHKAGIFQTETNIHTQSYSQTHTHTLQSQLVKIIVIIQCACLVPPPPPPASLVIEHS